MYCKQIFAQYWSFQRQSPKNTLNNHTENEIWLYLLED